MKVSFGKMYYLCFISKEMEKYNLDDFKSVVTGKNFARDNMDITQEEYEGEWEYDERG